MTTHLTTYEEKILTILDNKWGETTRRIAERCGHVAGGINRASQSSLVLNSLKRLEKRGLVKRLDDQLPVAWVLATPEGEQEPATPAPIAPARAFDRGETACPQP